MINHMNALGRSGNLSASDVFGVSKVPRASGPSLQTFSSSQTDLDGAAAVMNPICVAVCENRRRLFQCKFSAGDA